MSLKEIFIRRLQSVLYSRLRGASLKDWDTSDVYALSGAIIRDNQGLIDEYLESKTVSLGNLEDSISELAGKLLATVQFK
jgi:hypothetical protein